MAYTHGDATHSSTAESQRPVEPRLSLLAPTPTPFIPRHERRQTVDPSLSLNDDVTSRLPSNTILGTISESSVISGPSSRPVGSDVLGSSGALASISQSSVPTGRPTSHLTSIGEGPRDIATGESSPGAGVPVGVAVGAALGALVAGVLIVVLILCIWKRKRRARAKSLAGLAATSGPHSGSGRGPIIPFDRYENASATELAFIQKGMAEDLRHNPTSTSVAIEFPSEKSRLAAVSTDNLPVPDIRPTSLESSNATLTAPWSATPSNSRTLVITPSFPPPSVATSSSQYSTSSASRYSQSTTNPFNGLSPVSNPSSAVNVTQRTPFNDSPSLETDDAETTRSSDQQTTHSVLDLDFRQYDPEVLRRAIQLVNAENRAGRTDGALIEPPPAYQAGPLPR
ncbi:hypothetical protein BKA70DRAFT_828417 [Coprinopsis sp. MPI-PUGE-AT-0042]|nr:hypothetical protein BKA70DRAFT_828417 [Coprinopsis sp. MPI-PUGE-AT-0042]